MIIKIIMIKSIKRYNGVSAANTAKSVSTDVGKRLLLQQVTVAYSAAPTQAGTTVVLDSGLGAGYDCTLSTGTANARYTVYKPDTAIIINEDDIITVTAPAGGGVITASIIILTSEL